MKSRIVVFFFFLLSVSLCAQHSLEGRMSEFLHAGFLRVSDVSIAVFDLTADSALYKYRSEKGCRPASTEKVLTCITALDVLGGEYPVATALYHDGVLDGSVLRGNLYVKGGFDSEFAENDMKQLVQVLVTAGIRQVKGHIYGDVSLKDSVPYGAGWCWEDALYDYQPVLSPLMYHKGYLTLQISPSGKGKPANVEVVPAFHGQQIENKTLSATPQAGPLRVTRDLFYNSDQILVTGNVATTQRKTMTVSRPQDLFMYTFLSLLGKDGISHSGFGGYTASPAGAEWVGGVQRPLSELVRRAMKVSDNLSAEALFYHLAAHRKGMSHYATAKDGVQAIHAQMLHVGVDASECTVFDGSGLSSYNSISADVLVGFLRYAARHQPLFEVFWPTLPIAGVDGTLGNRMKTGAAYRNVRAKTGTITGVSALAGYLTASNGHVIAFAILNQHVSDAKEARAFQDRICQMLCE